MEMCKLYLLILVLVTLTFSADSRSRSRRQKGACRAKSLARYQLRVRTLWSKHTFPKQYPVHRPPAQWSTLVGHSHSSSFTMWREGENVTRGVMKMAELGDPRGVMQESSQGHNHVLDFFTAPAVTSGQGRTSTVFSVDGDHSQVSFMMRLVPSPDWFIGLSHVDLCSRGRWRKQVHINLRPYDAGTDRGLTFTAPNWPTMPRQPVRLITPQEGHKAHSFRYPDYKILPRIAVVDLDLVAEYRLRKTYSAIKALPVTSTPTKKTTHLMSSPTALPTSTAQAGSSTEKEQTKPPKTKDQTRVKNQQNDSAQIYGMLSVETTRSDTQEHNPSPSSKFQLKNKPTKKTSKARVSEPQTQPRTRFEPTSPSMSSEADNTALDVRQVTDPHTGEPLNTASPDALLGLVVEEVEAMAERPDEGLPLDCAVSQWSPWGACSRTCDLGTKQRRREVTRHPSAAGAVCPRVRQEAVCKVAGCRWKHFSFFTPSKRLRKGRKKDAKTEA